MPLPWINIWCAIIVVCVVIPNVVNYIKNGELVGENKALCYAEKIVKYSKIQLDIPNYFLPKNKQFRLSVLGGILHVGGHQYLYWWWQIGFCGRTTLKPRISKFMGKSALYKGLFLDTTL